MESHFSVHAIFPNYYDGTRVAYSLKSILTAMSSPSIRTHTYALTKTKGVESDVSALLPISFYAYTIKLVQRPCEAILHRFGHRMKPGDVVYFWMRNPPALTKSLQRKELWVVREMINCTMSRRRDELRRAHELLGQPDGSGITEADIAQERADLLAADAVFCPNDFVLESVLAYGVPPDHCIKTSYGWTDERINGSSTHLPKAPGLNLLFVGSADIRKGFPWLLEAWARSGVEGRLLIAGTIDPKIRADYAGILSRPDVVELGYVRDIGAVYRSADAFCFPSWEEGGPMVTIEAMGAGLPCIVTPMGSAGIVSEQTGGALIVEPGNVDAIAEAIRQLAADRDARMAMGRRAQEIAAGYTWETVGKRRGEVIVRLRERSALAGSR